MHRVKTSVRPSAESTSGCEPVTLRSMIESRRWASATGPWAQIPSPSGPRCCRQPLIRAQAATSAPRPSKRSSPARPHIRVDARARPNRDAVPSLAEVWSLLALPRARDDPGVLRAAASGGVDDEAALGRSEEHTSELQSRQYL